MGYEGVEFAGLYGKTAEEVKALMDETGLNPISAHVSLAEMLNDIDGELKKYAKIGCKYIVVPYLPEEYRPERGNFDETLKILEYFGEKVRDAGFTMLYHNHDFEFTKIDGEYYLDTIYSRVPAELLQTELDTCWVNVGGADPVAYVRKYTGRAPVVHLKDFFMRGRQKEGLYELIGIDKKADNSGENFGFRPVGHGMQNIPEILAASVDAGADWVIVEQDRPAPGQTAFESAQLSADYLKGLGLMA
ncbi:MAG: sugar phosphate isomerase/epimerase [Clostridia bacterium]|nr:sugar phosphate isomerase/epimerase [Clostridia bacterium]